MRLVRLLLVPVLLAGLTASCRRPKSGSPADGRLVGGLYTNLYFNFTVGIPAGWSVGELKTTTAPLPGSTRVPSMNPQAAAHQLLMASEHPVARGIADNPSLLVMAEKADAVPGVKNAKDYLARISQMMTDSPLAYRPINGIADVQLGGIPAVRLDFSAQLNKQKTGRQGYLVCQRDQYMLSFILSGPTDAEIKRLEQLLQTVKFY